MDVLGHDPDEHDETAADPIRISVLKTVERLTEIETEAIESGTFAVVVLDHLHVGDLSMHLVYEGFPSKEMAHMYARATVRDCIEELRGRYHGSYEDLYKFWLREGYDAFVLPGTYRARQEVHYFIRNPATDEERDWKSLLKSTLFE